MNGSMGRHPMDKEQRRLNQIASAMKWTSNNPEKHKIYRRTYYQKNKEIMKQKVKERRARLKAEKARLKAMESDTAGESDKENVPPVE